ncbi:hypothetical protein QTH91_10075 [Variovorax dokdonensis]|uniref:Lipoprotein n=1 Tax=Variovorax dokdonensis TaxID=344883 RepID=A0ABT7NAC1_9BURK|nr:hypothetical protein [Variovorax dokdonensis]MDM0044830.1 hypothetical protein [Variovorax dokdonensis]
MSKPDTRHAVAIVVLAALLGACTEQPQTAGTKVQPSKTWSGTQPSFNAAGWKPGDQASWAEEIKRRNLNQNEYVRIAH